MRKVNVSSVGDVHDQETAVAASEDRPDEQAEDVVQQPEGMTKTTPKAKKPAGENDADPRHQLTPEDLGKVYQSIWDRNRDIQKEKQ